MDNLIKLAELVKKRNLLEHEITALTNRPFVMGHTGEYIASQIFHIELMASASQKGIDGHFMGGLLSGRTVNIKWYAQQESLLDITPNALPDYYLVLTGPKSGAMSSRGQVRPWTIESVFLFEARPLVDELTSSGIKIGTATSIRKSFWAKAEIYPKPNNTAIVLSKEQHEALQLFKP
ncbi:MAG: hypothetical protein JNJ78_15620 [Anaerolineae bacterium]|mgnify:CR=1 FL=1|nr:hypothetical protein [Anaerolineae bacterium]